MFERARSTIKRRPAMQKISTMRTNVKNIFKGQLTIGLDLGDRSSAYCVLNEAGQIVLEHKVASTPEAMKQVFGSMPRCRMAMETGTHSPWVSRLLTALGHEVIVGHAQKVRLITKSRRKDDRLDARTLARLARIDPELLSPVKHRSAHSLVRREAEDANQVAAPTGSKITGLVPHWVVQDLVVRFDSRGFGAAGSFSKCALASTVW